MYVAVYNYNPSESSPNLDKDEELELRKGDLVKVIGELDDDGFYYAKVNGRKGYVPSNYLSKVKHSGWRETETVITHKTWTIYIELSWLYCLFCRLKINALFIGKRERLKEK